MAGKNESVMLLATMVIMAASIGISSAATYTVGGNTGWKIPPQPNFYSNWASQQTFQVGDVLGNYSIIFIYLIIYNSNGYIIII